MQTTFDFELIKTLRQEGYSTKKACEYLGISIGQLRHLGWNKLPNPNINLTNTYKKNTSYFDKIDTINKAYILGFTLADGNILPNGTLQYELHKKDKEILDFICKEISPDSLIKPINRIRNFKGYTWVSETLYLSIKCKQFYYDLDHFGIVSNKTYYKQSLPLLSWRLMPHFIRGYFDGDGSVYLNKNRVFVTFTGEHNLLLEIGDYLNYVSVLSKLPNVYKVKNQANSCFAFSKKSDVQCFYNFIYREGFYLKRKKEKFNYELT